MSITRHHTICRACHAGCGVIVDVDNGKPVTVSGDPDNPLYKGFCCIKGQNFHATRNSPERLLCSQKRRSDGSYQDIPVAQAMDEIAAKLQALIAEHGPRSVASYSGTMAANSSAINSALLSSWLKAIGSRMGFNSNTIDQPGKMVAQAFHGKWMAPANNFSEAQVLLLIGVNPLIAMSGGVPHTNPGRHLTDALTRGLKLIVIDPRRSETARRAKLFLQVKPGHDVALLAAMLNIIITEELYDQGFVAANVDGLDALRAAVTGFAPADVAQQAGVAADDLIGAARTFATASKGVVTAGTGPNMAGNTTLLEYLVLCMNTLCGRWQRAGEKVFEPASLGQPTLAKAQALPPYPEFAYGFGENIRVRGLSNTAAGMPTAALADEIITPGEGQVRALISHGGNPLSAWPDQLKTQQAFDTLELSVQIDVAKSATAQRADYVIAVKHPLECPGTTLAQEYLSEYAVGFGTTEAYAQYTPAIVEAPPGSELIEDWEFFYGLAQRMGLQLTMKPISFSGVVRVPGHQLDMQNKPDSEHLLDLLTHGSRIALSEVRKHKGGATYPDPTVFVADKDPQWTGRLDVGNTQMMADLADWEADADSNEQYPLKLLCRRQMNVLNSTGINIEGQLRGKPYNPAYLNPDDAQKLAVSTGDRIQLVGEHASIPAIVDIDYNLRPGTVSMTHCWGNVPELDERCAELGSNTGRLSSVENDYEKYTGMPRMSNIPVRIERLANE